MANIDELNTLIAMRDRLISMSNNVTNTFLDDLINDYRKKIATGGECHFSDNSNGGNSSTSSNESNTTIDESDITMEEPEDLSVNAGRRNTMNPNKRMISPIEPNNAKRRNIEGIVDRINISAMQSAENLYCSTPKTEMKVKPKVLHPFNAMFSKNMSAAALSNDWNRKMRTQNMKVGIDIFIKKLLFSKIPKGNKSIDFSEICLPCPVLLRWVCGDPKSDLNNDIVMLYEKLESSSDHSKDVFSSEKIESFPIEYEYNPNKSRQRREYNDDMVRAVRAKNNLASRHSRIKKKMCQQFIKWDVEYYQEENRVFFTQEYFLNHVLRQLEGEIMDVDMIMQLRNKCCMK